jgi:hypothetical protein
MNFLDLRLLFGPTRDLRTDQQRWKYEKQLRYAKARHAQWKEARANVLPYPFRRQAI